MRHLLTCTLILLAIACDPAEEPKADPMGYGIAIDTATNWCHVRDELLPHCVRCHEDNGPVLKGSDEAIWANLQRKASNQQPYVMPSEPEQSYLWHKIAGSHLEASVGGNGGQMPLGGFMGLGADEGLRLGLLSRDWIANGAGIQCGSPADAGPAADAGTVMPDGGSAVDAGTTAPDAGAPVVPDAGLSVPDAGEVVVPDAGIQAPPDAGQQLLNCAGLRACYAQCPENDNACQNRCADNSTPEAQEDITRLLQCIVLNGCHQGDLAARQACTAQHCAPELALCE